MATTDFELGDNIEVFHERMLMRGKIVDLDLHPFKESYAQIEVDSPALPAPVKWVDLRMARKVEGL